MNEFLESVNCIMVVVLLYQYSRLNKKSIHNCFYWKVVQENIKYLLNAIKSFYIMSICIFSIFMIFTIYFVILQLLSMMSMLFCKLLY